MLSETSSFPVQAFLLVINLEADSTVLIFSMNYNVSMSVHITCITIEGFPFDLEGTDESKLFIFT